MGFVLFINLLYIVSAVRALKNETLTTSAGAPIGDKLNSITSGPRGPTLLQDTVFLEEMGHFDRERIPERVVHAKGAGAFGYFEVTNDITQYCKAKVFSNIGKRTPIFVRFSTVAGEKGSADTVQELRGFALKFYTEDGNWDLIGNNSPVFYIRDAILFPSLIHSQKKSPLHDLWDRNMFWDFVSLRPETTHQITFTFSDRGMPDGFRFMDGFGSNTFKLVNSNGNAVYCKFHYKTDQGIKYIPADVAQRLRGTDPDYARRDLFNAIESGNYPSWTFYIQVMTFEEAEKWYFNPFDITKVWPQDEFPLIEVGKLVINRNPDNFFAQVEQSAFAPSHLVSGIEPSPDKILQGRLFSYTDSQRYRLGVNFKQIPINCPFRSPPRNYERDGQQTFAHSQRGEPNYHPNSFGGPVEDRRALESCFRTSGDVARWNSTNEDNFTQAGIFYRKELNESERTRLISNIVNDLSQAQEFIQERVVKLFYQADPDYGKRVERGLRRLKKAQTTKK